jgi:hypothetical protein
MVYSASMLYPGKDLDRDDSFRLLEIHPGQQDDPIVVSLLNGNLNDAPSYEALSYVWGDISAVRSIRVVGLRNVSTEGIHLPITLNCYAAILRLRRPDDRRVLWIDSICINQELVAERNHQLELIPLIYSRATRVIVYLGSNTEDSDAALTWISEIDSPLDDNDEAPWDKKPQSTGPVKDLVEQLFQRKWFHRIWVLQEIRFAKDAVVVCGDKEIEWRSFKSFKYWNDNQKWVRQLPYPVQWSTMKLTSGFGGGHEFLSPFPKRLLRKLRNTRNCGATDPRDKVFAILPLLDWEEREFEKQKRARMIREKAEKEAEAGDDGTDADADASVEQARQNPEALEGTTFSAEVEHTPQQDRYDIAIEESYEIPTATLFTKLAEGLINALGLEVLKEAFSSSSLKDLPSWAPDWSTDFAYPFLGLSRRADRKLYSVTRFKDIEWNSTPYVPPSPRTWSFSSFDASTATDRSGVGRGGRQLHVRGIILGTITKLGDLANIYDDHLPLRQWESLIAVRDDLLTVTDKSPMPPSDAGWDEHNRWNLTQLSIFVRNLAGDKITYRSAVEIAVARIRVYNGDIRAGDSDRLVRYFEKQIKKEDEEGQERGEPKMRLRDVLRSMGVSYEDQAEAIFYQCHGRRFFVSDGQEKRGEIGFAPWNAEIGDRIVAIEGVDAVFIVRTVDESASDAQVVKIVGEGYLQGVKPSDLSWIGGSNETVVDLVIR